MYEHGTATALYTRALVVAEHDNNIVKIIVAPETFSARWIGMADRTIIIAVPHRIAPAHIPHCALDG